MRAYGVVEDFETGEHIVLRCRSCGVVLEMEQFAFEAAEEILRKSVVIGDAPVLLPAARLRP